MKRAGLDKIFVLTGLPRSGTTYLAAVLYNPPDVITLSEAGGKWKEFYAEKGANEGVLDIMLNFRNKILAGEEMSTFEGTPGFEGEGKVDTWNQKKLLKKLDASQDFHLGLKNPEIFIAFLDVFAEAGLKCVATIRHPASVINSWVKKVRGRLEKGFDINGKFANGDSLVFSSQAKGIIQRRIELYNALAAILLKHKDDKNLMIIRHEDWYADKAMLERVTGFLGVRSLGYLRPAPIPPDPLIIPEDEQREINLNCLIASEFGYPAEKGSLKPVIAVPAEMDNGRK